MKNPHLIRRVCDHIGRKRYCYVTIVLVFILLKWGVTAYGSWGARQLECTYTQLSANTLPGSGPLKIALVTDLHNNKELFGKTVQILREQKPDLIVLGGDLVTADQRFMRTRWVINYIRDMAAVAPTFAILGNHDYEKQEQVERVYHTAGIQLLRNEALDWSTPTGTTIRIIGLGDWNEGDENPAVCMLPEGQETKPVLLLAHDPESRFLLNTYDWDLMLAGHTHGGQIGIPFTNHYISFRSDMPSGLYTYTGERHIFVSRGVGATWNMRFFCPPEVNILEITN